LIREQRSDAEHEEAEFNAMGNALAEITKSLVGLKARNEARRIKLNHFEDFLVACGAQADSTTRMSTCDV
jgi:hypothetical protein